MQQAAAAPFRPGDPDQVLLEMPARAELGELRAADGAYRAAPSDPRCLQRLVAAQLDAGRRYADPRYFGQAEALLANWRNTGPGSSPIGFDIAWADIQQHRHDYTGARTTLDAVLRRNPDNVQAHLMRAQLGLAEGRLQEARSDCAALAREGALGLGCLAQVIGMSGNLARAEELLDHALASGGRGPTASWLLSARADMAARSADPRSIHWLEQALAADPTDQYARLALADSLIDAGRLEAAQETATSGPRSDGALLRLAIIAAHRLPGSAASDPAALELQARHAEAEARGERVHLRDLARFRLEVLHDVPGALTAARENFAAQRETWDARILLQAAHAAGDRAAAHAVVEWRHATGFEDRTLEPLLRWAEVRT
jgi:thioredoxin-like negative regulator of GroEL